MFLSRRFVPASTRLRNWVRRSADLDYSLSPTAVPYPPKPDIDLIREAVLRANGLRTMREILDEIGVDRTDLKAVSDFRMRTTTSLCPYLKVQM
jgi:hypothetical protein